MCWVTLNCQKIKLTKGLIVQLKKNTMATLETITSASPPTLKPVKYVTEGYNSIKFVGVATYREFLEDVKETSRIVIEVSLLKSNNRLI